MAKPRKDGSGSEAGGVPSGRSGFVNDLAAFLSEQIGDTEEGMEQEQPSRNPPQTLDLVASTAEAAQLASGSEVNLVIRDKSGRFLGLVVGHFIPTPEGDPEAFALAKAAFTDDVVEKARQEPGGRSLDEILAKLGR